MSNDTTPAPTLSRLHQNWLSYCENEPHETAKCMLDTCITGLMELGRREGHPQINSIVMCLVMVQTLLEDEEN